MDRDHLLRFNFPCPHCGYRVTVQVIDRQDRCPECGEALPLIPEGHANPLIAWPLLTGQNVRRDRDVNR